MNLKFISKSLSLLLLCLFLSIPAVFADDLDLTGQAYVQDNGWLNPVGNDGLIGTVGLNKNLEAFKLNTTLGGIYYSSHVSGIGWQSEKNNNQISGTTEQNLPIEAIQIQLGSDLNSNYDILYRVHCADIGWLDWTENGEIAGTTGLSIPIQAIEVKLVPKGSVPDSNGSFSYLTSSDISQFDNIEYQCHCAYLGWQENVENGSIAGTTGESRQVEAFKINASNVNAFSEDSHLEYSAHSQYYGWLDSVSEGQVAGTEGQGLSVQAIKVKLSGKIKAVCDVYYRVHVSGIGWLDWAKNGEIAGTTGFNVPVEAMEIIVQPKSTPAPGETKDHCFTSEDGCTVTTQSYVENIGWMDPVEDENPSGTEGRALGIEAINLSVPDLNDDSSIFYELYIEDIGWQGEYADGDTAGTIGQNKQAEAIRIHLTGTIAQLYDIYYTTQCSDYGWLGWAHNNEPAGTYDGNKKLETVKIKLVPKASADIPTNSEEAFLEAKTKITAADVPNFNLICAIVQHEGGASYEGALAVMSCVMNRCDSGRWGGTDPVSVLTAPGQFASYLEGYYLQFINNPSPIVQQAVLDCLNGVRSHPYQSFRSYATSGSVCIGGNWFF